MPISGKKVKKKMQNEKKEFVTVLQGKSVREFAQRLVNGAYRIEKQSLNRYKVYETSCNDYTLINRRSFVLLDKELYKLQARENPLAFAIEKALDDDLLTFCISKASIDTMPVKLIARTFSSAKVTLEGVKTSKAGSNYLLTIALVKAISERDLTQKELEIAEIFIKANEIANAAAGNPETTALPAPETVETTAKTVETIPEK